MHENHRHTHTHTHSLTSFQCSLQFHSLLREAFVEFLRGIVNLFGLSRGTQGHDVTYVAFNDAWAKMYSTNTV